MRAEKFIIESHWGIVIDKLVHWGLWIIIGMQIGTGWPALTNELFPYLYASCVSVFLVRAIHRSRWFQPRSPSSRIFGDMQLDRVGDMLGVKRNIGESNDDYRKRIDRHISVR